MRRPGLRVGQLQKQTRYPYTTRRVAPNGVSLGRADRFPPAAEGYDGPRDFDYAEGPCALEESVDGAQDARYCEREN